MQEGKKETLTATISPENATNKNVKWSTSNSEVAKVENGVVTALKEGEAIITVTTDDGGKTAQCKVSVEKAKESPDDIYEDDDKNKPDDNNDTDNTNTNNTIIIKGDKDDTLANKELPKAGIKNMVITVLGIVIIGGMVFFVKYKNMKEVK